MTDETDKRQEDNNVTNGYRLLRCLTGRNALLFFLLGAVIVIGYSLDQGQSKGFVTFDTVKYINARRQMTTRLLGHDNKSKNEAISVLSGVQKSTMPAIKAAAKGRVVLVKQAVVMNDQVPDITNKVLKKLGLPTDAATVQPQNPDKDKLMTPYGTSLSYLHAQKQYNDRVAEGKKQRAEAQKARKEAKHKKREEQIKSLLP